MTSHRYLTCLFFFLSAFLTDVSKADCNDYFKKSELKTLIDKLPDNIPIQMDHEPKDIMMCSIRNTTLKDCFEEEDTCKRESSNKIVASALHLMCLSNIAMIDAEKSKADVCNVYEKVCKPQLEPSSISAPKMTAPISSTTATSTTATAPPSSTSTSSRATTVSPATPTTESVTTNTTTVSPTPVTATAQLLAQTAQSDQRIRELATKETDIVMMLKIGIAFLIFTNVLGPLGVYVYMRRQMNKETFKQVNQNVLDEVQSQLETVI